MGSARPLSFRGGQLDVLLMEPLSFGWLKSCQLRGDGLHLGYLDLYANGGTP